jgi:hypothetical protein
MKLKSILKDIKLLFSFGKPKVIYAMKYKSVNVNDLPIDIYNYPSFVKHGDFILKTPYNKHIKLKNEYEGRYHLYAKINLKKYKKYTMDDNGIYESERIFNFDKDFTDKNLIIALIVNLYYCLVERLKVYKERIKNGESIDRGHSMAYLFVDQHIQFCKSILGDTPFTFLEDNNYQDLISELEKFRKDKIVPKQLFKMASK